MNFDLFVENFRHTVLTVQRPQKFNQDQDHKTMVCQDREFDNRAYISMHLLVFYDGVESSHIMKTYLRSS